MGGFVLLGGVVGVVGGRWYVVSFGSLVGWFCWVGFVGLVLLGWVGFVGLV